MRVLIIGGTRFTGPHIVRRLVAAGHEVVLFHRHPAEVDLPESVRHLYGDRDELSEHTDRLVDVEPDVVLDMIPLFARHAEAVVEIFGGVADRIVAISSQDVYRAFGRVQGLESGAPEPTPLAEDAPLRTGLYPYRERFEPDHRLYDYDKIPVERVYLGCDDLPATILRYPRVYGPGDPQHRLLPYLVRMADDRPAILLGEDYAAWRWTAGYVENVARAVSVAITDERAGGRIYNIGRRDPPTEADRIRLLGEVVGWEGRVLTVPDERVPEALSEQISPDIDTDQHLVFDTSRIRAELGYEESIDLPEALRRTARWERQHGPGELDDAAPDYEAEDALLDDLGLSESPA